MALEVGEGIFGVKPCVCRGGNENCKYCSGLGWVPDERVLRGGGPSQDLLRWGPSCSEEPPQRTKPLYRPKAVPPSPQPREPSFWDSGERLSWLLIGLIIFVALLLKMS